MLSAWIIITSLISDGINPYLATIPLIVIYGAAALFLEKLMPFNREWLKGEDWNLDFTYYIINYAIKVAAQLGFIWIASNYVFLEWFPLDLPFWIQVVIALFIIDFFLYLVHWLSHQYDWLWKLHAIHHSSERLYFLNGEKRHVLHQILEGGPGIILCLIIGTPHTVIIAALAFLAINMMMQHTNLDYKAGILKNIFSVAELHRWHHREDYEDAQVNYGAWLAIWDHVFRTYFHDPKIVDLSNIGKIGIEEPDFPNSYIRQFAYPFRKRNKKVSDSELESVRL
jgi:sterol desaturase/sphingolipid hydroxylase (fatty acid hydroxylase superfamily)